MHDDASTVLSYHGFLLLVHRHDIHLLVAFVNSALFKYCFPICDLNLGQTQHAHSICNHMPY